MKAELWAIDQFGDEIILTEECHQHILFRQEMVGQEERIKETLQVPDLVNYSRYDRQKLLYYRFYDKTPVTQKYLVVIVKKLPRENFIITSFYTDKVKVGETLWQR